MELHLFRGLGLGIQRRGGAEREGAADLAHAGLELSTIQPNPGDLCFYGEKLFFRFCCK
jgi:hypothetical protein